MTARPDPVDEEGRLLDELVRINAQASRITARLSKIRAARAAGRVAPLARDPDLISAAEAADFLGVDHSTMTRLARKFSLGHQTKTGKWRISTEKLMSFRNH